MQMAIAILLGVVVGVVGFVPLAIAIRLTRKAIGAGIGANVGIVLLCLFISLGFLIAAIFIFNDANHAYVIPFGLTASIVLSITAIGFGLYQQAKHK